MVEKRFSPHFLETLKERSSLVEVVSRETRLTHKGDEHTGLCPFHKEKTPSFSVSERKGVYYCFGCGASGNIFDFIKQKHNISFFDAVFFLAKTFGLSVSQPTQEAEHHVLYEVLARAAVYFQACLYHPQWGSHARRYLERRHVDYRAEKRFSLGYAPRKDHFMRWVHKEKLPHQALVSAGLLSKTGTMPWFYDRLIFPIHDRQGQVIAFGGRILQDQRKPKYLNSPETPLFSKKNVLYGLHGLSQDKFKKILVVEGYMDVVSLWSQGLTQGGYGAVAPLGTALSLQHIQRLWSYAETPVLCFDGDGPGQLAAFRACEKMLPVLRPGKSAAVALMPPGQDPDDVVTTAGVEKLFSLCEEALPLHVFFARMFLYQKASGGVQGLSPEKKTDLRNQLISYTSVIVHKGIASAYRNAFYEAFYEAMKKQKAQPQRPLIREVSLYHWRCRSERLLMAAFYYHPSLLPERLLHLESHAFQESALSRIYEALHSCLETHKLESSEIREMLSQHNCPIERLTDPLLHVHGYFLKPSTPLKEVMASWDRLWHYLTTLPQAHTDLTQACCVLASEMSPKSWAHVKNLSSFINRINIK